MWEDMNVLFCDNLKDVVMCVVIELKENIFKDVKRIGMIRFYWKIEYYIEVVVKYEWCLNRNLIVGK